MNAKEIFEEKMEKIETCCKRAESQEYTLEERIKYYEEGIKIYEECRNIVEESRNKFVVLREE